MSKRIRVHMAMLAVTALIGTAGPLARVSHANAAESEVSLEGEVEIVISDDFENDRSRRTYRLREKTGGRVLNLRFKKPPGHLRSGQRVRIRGRMNGVDLQVQAVEGLGADAGSSGDAAALVVAERSAIVMIVDFQDVKTSARYSVQQIADNVWSGFRSMDDIYQAASWDQFRVPDDTDGDGFVDVVGPYLINYAAMNACDTAYYDWAYAADAAAVADGVDLSRYRHRIYILPRYTDIGCRWAGRGNLGCGGFCRSWITAAEWKMVILHELGHNLGMHHASTDPENDGVVNSEYGDHSDGMGNSISVHGFNAAHSDQMGWFAAYPGTLEDVTSEGTFDLRPMSVHPLDEGGIRALKIPANNPSTGFSEHYYLSYRQRTGYDDSMSPVYTSGVNIHRRGSGSDRSRFVAALTDGGSFEDPINGLALTQVGHATDGSYVTVQVGFAACSDGVDNDEDGLVDFPDDPDCTGRGGNSEGSGGDVDGDGTSDSQDNCQDVPNPGQLDSDRDGYGNACDGDLNNDGFVTPMDVRAYINALKGFSTSGDGRADLNGDGVVSLLDNPYFVAQLVRFYPGPSGLACAGTIPCK